MRTELDAIEVLVTGASGGIGGAIVDELSDCGARSWIHYRSQRKSAVEVAERVGADAARVVQADVSIESEVDQLFATIASQAELSGLVVNAGLWAPESVPISEMSLEQWRHTMANNLESAFLCCRAFLRGIKPDGPAPAIVLIGSTSGIFGEEGHGDYSSSKAAMRGLMLTMKNEIVRLHPRGRVNLVNPGWVATPMAAAALEDKALVERVTATIPMRKVATAQDVASTVVYLLSERLAGHVSGQAIMVAGGMEGRLLHPPS